MYIICVYDCHTLMVLVTLGNIDTLTSVLTHNRTKMSILCITYSVVWTVIYNIVLPLE